MVSWVTRTVTDTYIAVSQSFAAARRYFGIFVHRRTKIQARRRHGKGEQKYKLILCHVKRGHNFLRGPFTFTGKYGF
ncbi:hypothetical protein RclHR1_00010038 [Rhizophagus clarus]|uniref:Uncharacterized protein n=1 Tax=Rhizophagus clarus TaxID=94130 RepID=A0A2Z6QS90_9GLOM|nr:hypothetical protein RclHR1_00010038 [Rhizophagus clarus]